MDVHLEHDFMTQTYKVWVTSGHLGQVMRAGPDPQSPWSWSWEDLPPSNARSDIPPTFVMPEQLLKALIAAGADVLPPDRAQAEHLADAIHVRDRLLDLVARAHPYSGPFPAGQAS